ncbi:GTP cyclohydrolase I [Actinacidiphila oryziradicis]|nr:GTP cyclohydrolase I [Actinacidiphila oryziradicis]
MTTITSLDPQPGDPLDPKHGGELNGQAGIDLDLAARHARAMLACLGIACEDEHTIRTPERFVRAMAEMTAGRHRDPHRFLDVTFPAEPTDPGMIVVTGVRFVSLCQHHLLPWAGTASVAYIPAPGARIVGLSKLARLVKEFAARPQIQERLGQQIVHAIDTKLSTIGAACVIRASHSCMNLRGAHAQGAHMVTTHVLGAFHDDPTVRAEFLSLTPTTQLDHNW